MDITVNTTQIDALKEFFNGLSNADKRTIFITAFRRVAKPIINDARLLIPRKSGNLASSIGTVSLGNEIALLVGAKKPKGSHGHLIENGTVERFRRNGASTGRVIGIHFMETAYNMHDQDIPKLVEEEWLKAIDKFIIKTLK